jgi:hypothetical protein
MFHWEPIRIQPDYLRTVKMPVPFHKPPQSSTVKLNNRRDVADIRERVTDAFTATRVQRCLNGGASKEPKLLVETSFDAAGRLEIHCRSGLLPALRGWLLLHGIRTSGNGTASNPHAFTAGFGTWNPQVVDFVTAVDWGRVLVNRRKCSLASVVADIINGLPNSKIVVIVESDAQQFRGSLRPLTFRGVDLAPAQNFDAAGSNVTVSTWRSLGRSGLRRAGAVVVVDPLITDKLDPMFADYAEPGEVARYCAKLDKMGDVTGKLIAVLDVDTKYSPFELVRLNQVFGSMAVRVLSDNTDPANRAFPRKAFVLWGRSKGANGLGSANDPFALKSAMWNSRSYNRHAAKVAKALAAGDAGAVGDIVRQVPAEWVAGRPLRVAAYVESLDHAEVLGRKLPGWPINPAPGGPPVPGCGVIVTEMGAGAVDATAFDVVVRADLGVGMPNALLEWTKTPFPMTQPLYVVDFVARDGALARKWYKSRRDAYLDADWPDYGVRPDVHAYRTFRRAVTRRDVR